ncbi:MAG: DNA repair protein RecO [Bacteroidaceae bacterium]|nr:DNA repair protein RecO [Bacteroidaceae bacterium]
MVEKFIGVVLRTIKYSDNLMIADMYTQSHGRQSFLVPVSRSKRSKVRNVLFQPLSILSFTATYKGNGSLSRLSEVQPHVMYGSIPYDVVKSSIALYLADFLSAVLREEGESESLYAFLDYSLNWLDSASEGYANFHIVFLLHLTRFLGIAPNVEEAIAGSYFDLAAGCIVHELPLHSQYLTPEDTSVFIDILGVDYSSMHILQLSRNARWQYLTLLHNYYRLHIPELPDIKSIEILRELFS